LKAPLKQLEKDVKPVAAKYASLEARTNTLLRNYNDHVNSNFTLFKEGAQLTTFHAVEQITNLSELFVSWNDLVTEAEEAVTKLEKERNQPLDIS